MATHDELIEAGWFLVDGKEYFRIEVREDGVWVENRLSKAGHVDAADVDMYIPSSVIPALIAALEKAREAK